MSRVLVLLIAWFALFAGCSATEKIPAGTETAETQAPDPTDDEAGGYGVTASGPVIDSKIFNSGTDLYHLISAEVTKDSLYFKVQFGGGCAKHVFILAVSEDRLVTDDREVILKLIHDAGDDVCRAMKRENLVFSAAKFQGEKDVKFVLEDPFGDINPVEKIDR